jgi:sec-independent protein translocase protein TatA
MNENARLVWAFLFLLHLYSFESIIMSGGEILLIFFVALLLFGSEKLPGLARGLARGMQEFRKATDEIKRELTENPEISNIKKDLDGIRENLTGSFNEIRQSVSSPVESAKQTINSEVEGVKNTMNDHAASLNQEVKNIEQAASVEPQPETDFHYDVYKEAEKIRNMQEAHPEPETPQPEIHKAAESKEIPGKE